MSQYSYQEYLRFEETTDAKHEYLDGQILAMAGGTLEHAALAAALIGILSHELAGGDCYALSSDLRVRVRASGLATYPDASVICGPAERDADDHNAATNPTALFEVLSDSTESYDRGEKFAHYRLIPSLREYVLVSHRGRRLERHSRQPDGSWLSTEAAAGAALELAALGVSLSVDALYERSPLTAGLGRG